MEVIDKKAVGQRLRAVLKELGHTSTQTFADYLGQQRGAVDSWLNGRALPPVVHLARLHQDFGITFDWIYLDDSAAMPHGRLIRLRALLLSMEVPEAEADVGPEVLAPEAARAAAHLPRKKTKKAI